MEKYNCWSKLDVNTFAIKLMTNKNTNEHKQSENPKQHTKRIKSSAIPHVIDCTIDRVIRRTISDRRHSHSCTASINCCPEKCYQCPKFAFKGRFKDILFKQENQCPQQEWK